MYEQINFGPKRFYGQVDKTLLQRGVFFRKEKLSFFTTLQKTNSIFTYRSEKNIPYQFENSNSKQLELHPLVGIRPLYGTTFSQTNLAGQPLLDGAGRILMLRENLSLNFEANVLGNQVRDRFFKNVDKNLGPGSFFVSFPLND